MNEMTAEQLTPILYSVKGERDQLKRACESALYLLGDDCDRELIGPKPWGNRGATYVIEMLRKALGWHVPQEAIDRLHQMVAKAEQPVDAG